MDIGNSIRRSGRESTIIKSIIWNNIIAIFQAEKNIDITDYLTSIRMTGKSIFVKTSKPIINTELLLLDDKIKKSSEEKLQKLGIKLGDFELKYI